MLGKKIIRDTHDSNKNNSAASNTNAKSKNKIKDSNISQDNQNNQKAKPQKNKNEKKIKKQTNKENQNKSQLSYNNKPTVVQSTFYKDEDGIDLLNEAEALAQNKSQSDTLTEGKWINKQRTLVVASRGISHQERYLVNDIMSLLPHAKKECKIEKNTAREELNDVCFNHSCKNALYFEHRRRELVMWLFRSPDGPCAKFQVRNIHTLTEIKMTGNCLKYSRPLLSFDESFEKKPHLKLMKEMFTHTFNAPKNHPKSKPFYDHVLSFCNVNDNIFFRNFQIVNELKDKFCDGDDVEKLQLIEIGPRFSMNLIRIFDGPLGGKTIYQNPNYISPAFIRKKNSEKFKLRNVKETNRREVLENQIKNIQEDNYKWLNKD
jgi:ribosome biogenesis protein BRX1